MKDGDVEFETVEDIHIIESGIDDIGVHDVFRRGSGGEAGVADVGVRDAAQLV
jgi:hypothetical protein